VIQRMYRFAYPFHTGVAANAVIPQAMAGQTPPQGNGTTAASIWADIEAEIDPVTPQGIATDNQGNGDITSQTPLKIAKARRAVHSTFRLMAHDLMTAAYWMDVRRVQNGARGFGAGPTAALAAYRQVSPWQVAAADRPDRPAADLAVEFLTSTPASRFLPAGALPAP
jgi:histidine ammonia-lyase